jgi:hypothetical protein
MEILIEGKAGSRVITISQGWEATITIDEKDLDAFLSAIDSLKRSDQDTMIVFEEAGKPPRIAVC